MIVLAAALSLVGVFLIAWRIGRRLRNLGDRRHEVAAPDGRVWATRLHWGRPRAGFGLSSRLFPRRRVADPPVAPPPQLKEETRNTKGRGGSDLPLWLEGPLSVFELFDPVLLVSLLVGSVLAIGLAILLAVALALELFVVLAVAAAYGVARALFGHPWVIEVDPPTGTPYFVPVRGFRAATAEQRRLRTLIELGRYEPEGDLA